MLEGLTHALFGQQGAGNNIAGATQGSVYPGGSLPSAVSAAQYNAIMQKEQVPKSRKLFHGTVEVLQVANGYIVNIGRKEGYEYETYIADTITDVNERIAAAIVAFQLEGK
jgi:hypothetical protein